MVTSPDISQSAETQFLANDINIEHVVVSGQGKALTNDFNQFGYFESFSKRFAHLKNPLSDEYLSTIWKAVYFVGFDKPKSGIIIEKGDYSSIQTFEQEELPEFYKGNLNKLSKAFKADLLKKKDSLSVPEATAVEIFKKISNHLAELSFEDSAVEIINSDSLKFTLLFPNKKILRVTKPFSPHEIGLASDGIISSLFINRKLIASDVSDISAFTKGFKKYLTM